MRGATRLSAETLGEPLPVKLLSPLPRHVAIIMDGNGRWANARGLSRLEGHRHGVKAAERTIKATLKHGIPYLTLFAFSRENWQRPRGEVEGLMVLLENSLARSRMRMFGEEGVRLSVFGDKSALPASLSRQLESLEQLGRSRECRLNLGLALNYGGRADIVGAAQQFARSCLEGKRTPGDLDESLFARYLETAPFPDPDMLVRTGGEKRLSNFLLWQGSYTELMFCDCLWPDFSESRFDALLEDFRGRDRRFGS